MSDRDNGDLDRRLRRERPEPHDEFVSSLAHRLTSAPTPRRAGWRIALAGGFTALLTLAFAMTGGIGYAANAVHGGTTAVTDLVTGPSNAGQTATRRQRQQGRRQRQRPATGSNGRQRQPERPSTNPSGQASSQGEGKTTVCHVPSGNPDNPQTITVADSAVADHLANHPGDSLGPCEEDGGSGGDQYGEKVLICHIPPGNPDHPITISVSQNAVPAHLAHGDTEGPCPDED